ncbi:MAG: sensor domain-containing diguanylate cyclase [Spirochaetes bacterium]|nr:sensor domain-containing diguanylate cyclase [Spirochaetota bacterium]
MTSNFHQDNVDREAGETLLSSEMIRNSPLFDGSQLCMLLLNSQGMIVTANRSILKAVESEPERIIGKPIWQIPELRESFQNNAMLTEAAKNIRIDAPACFELIYSSCEGKRGYLDCTIKPVSGNGDRAPLFLLEGWNVTGLKESLLELKSKSLHDDLTGLPNGRYLEKRLCEAIKRSKRTGMQFAVVFIDLDGFRMINETHGRPQGDFLLLQVSHRLKHMIRGIDTIARIGGDAFVLVIESIQSNGCIEEICARLLTIISRTYVLSNKKEALITASIGVSLYPDHSLDPEELVRHADTAMVRAKEEGRNSFRIHTPPQ